MSRNGRVRLLGYTRVSTSSQDAQLQLDALVAEGVPKRDVFADVTSGSKTSIERRGMKKLLEYAQSGDTVVVWWVDRLGRTLDPDDFTDAQAIAAIERITRGNFRFLERLFPQIARVLKIDRKSVV